MSRAVARTPWLLCAFHAAHMALLPVAIMPLFCTQVLHLSVTQLLSVQAFFGLVVALAEFPSGYVADRLGHRRALLVGSLVAAVGWVIYSFATGMIGLLAAEFSLGLGMALISGADSALLYESLTSLEREVEFARWYGRMHFWGQLAEGSAAVGAGFLYALSVRLPFAVEVGLALLAALLTVGMHAGMQQRVGRAHLAHMGWIVRETCVRRPELRAVVLTTVAFSLSSFMPVWLVALYAVQNGVREAWIGVVWALANYMVALGAFASDWAGRRFGLMRTLVGCIGLLVLGYAGLSLLRGPWAVTCYFAITLMRGLNGPLLHHAEQRLLPEQDRAGFVSFRSLLFRGSYVVLGPLIGLGVDRYGQHAMLAVLGAGATAMTATAVRALMLRRALPTVRTAAASASDGT